MQRAFSEFIQDVEARTFPGPEHTVDMDESEWQQFVNQAGQ